MARFPDGESVSLASIFGNSITYDNGRVTGAKAMMQVLMCLRALQVVVLCLLTVFCFRVLARELSRRRVFSVALHSDCFFSSLLQRITFVGKLPHRPRSLTK